MSKDCIVIIGGDAAGMSAAAKIRRAQPGRNILVLERTAFTSYSACGMPYFLGGLLDDFEQLIARSPETFREKYAIDVRTGHEVIAVDPSNPVSYTHLTLPTNTNAGRSRWWAGE